MTTPSYGEITSTNKVMVNVVNEVVALFCLFVEYDRFYVLSFLVFFSILFLVQELLSVRVTTSLAQTQIKSIEFCSKRK